MIRFLETSRGRTIPATLGAAALFALSSCTSASDQEALPPEIERPANLSGYLTPVVARQEWWICNSNQCQLDPNGNALLIVERGEILFLDGGSPADGPAYFVRRATGEVLAICGGALMISTPAEREKCSFEYWEARI